MFFVLTKSGTDADEQIDKNVCEYDNVLCIEHQDTLYNNEDELQAMVFRLTEKFHRSFAKFFGPPLMGKSIGLGEQSAISRLKEMNAAVKAMAYEPYDVVDPKFGVHGGMGKQEGDQKSDANQGGLQMEIPDTSSANEPNTLAPRRLFYCGSTGSGENRHHSTMGIYLANAFFPEVVGGAPNSGREAAVLLTPGTYPEATRDDFLVYLMHQHCDVDVLKFPGLQLHVNHPTYAYNAYGEYTPPADNIFVIGAHEDGPHSIQLPYAMMKWWNLVKGLGGSSGELDRATMDKFFIPAARPKNTRKGILDVCQFSLCGEYITDGSICYSVKLSFCINHSFPHCDMLCIPTGAPGDGSTNIVYIGAGARSWKLPGKSGGGTRNSGSFAAAAVCPLF